MRSTTTTAAVEEGSRHGITYVSIVIHVPKHQVVGTVTTIAGNYHVSVSAHSFIV